LALSRREVHHLKWRGGTIALRDFFAADNLYLTTSPHTRLTVLRKRCRGGVSSRHRCRYIAATSLNTPNFNPARDDRAGIFGLKRIPQATVVVMR